MFYAQNDKAAMISDERFNNGGQIPDRCIELLNRPALAYWDVRDGKNWSWPPVAHFGPKVMLINGWSGSGGDAFPRSEEHTSELQSLMRSSYAVFCLKNTRLHTTAVE